MFRSERFEWTLAGAGLACLPLLAAAMCATTQSSTQAAATTAIPAVKTSGKLLIAASEMKWVPMPGLPGAQQVPLAGDPTKEAHRILYKWPAGTKAPLHTHSFGDRGVIVSGTLSLAVEGAAPKMLPVGSYFTLAAGVQHITAVEGDLPCVFYLEREGPFDVKMVEGE